MGVSPARAALVVLAGLALLLGPLAGGCGAEEGGAATEAGSTEALRDTAIAAASLSGVPALELRYVLSEEYGLDAKPPDGDVRLVESPAGALLDQLRAGETDAAVLRGQEAFEASQSEDLTVLSHLAEEMGKLTGSSVMDSMLLTYPDVVERGEPALVEMNRMLAESATYFEANQGAVIEAVASEQDADIDFLRWWWERNRLGFGQMSADTQRQATALWQAAQSLGDIETFPTSAETFFVAGATATAEAADSARATISLAVLDDPSRRAALYAIEQGLVSSDSADIDVTYLSETDLEDAATTKQFMVIEANPLVVPQAAAAGGKVIVLSGGFLDLDGTLLFVRSAR